MNESSAALSTPALIAIYSILIIAASLAGGWLPIAARLTHTRLQVAISFVAGLMLGVGLLHMLPHAWHQLRSIDRVVMWMLAGFLAMFFAQRFFHFHHHDVPDDAAEHDHFSHKNHEHCQHSLAEQSASRLSWVGAAVGMTLHSLMDGLALAASVQAESAGDGGLLRGLGAFLVILLHKPFDAMAISTLMTAGGRSKYSCHLVNGLFALAIPLGVALFYLGLNQSAAVSADILGATLAFAAGTFLCISTSDLLPEIQFHTHDRIKLSVGLLAGLGVSLLIGWLETSGHDHHHHDHDHEEPHAACVFEMNDAG
jgi:zinc and cadmium transporter